MKKILLFSLFGVVCAGFVNVAMAEGPDGDDEHVCTGTSCAYIPSGGDAEQWLCFLEKKDGEKNPPSGYRDLKYTKYWVQNEGADCTSKKDGASKAVCKTNPSKEDADNVSCTAWHCKSGYLLQTTNARTEIKVTKRYLQGDTNVPDRVASQGRCISESWLNTNLCQQGCGCKDNEKCVVNKFVVSNHSKDIDAFLQQRACVCVYKTCKERYPNNAEAQACCDLGLEWDTTNNTCKCGDNKIWNKDEKQCEDKKSEKVDDDKMSKCWYQFNFNINCKNGDRYTKKEKRELTKEQAEEIGCTSGQVFKDFAQANSFEEIRQQIGEYDKLIKLVCGSVADFKSVSDFDGGKSGMSEEYAKKTLEKFFKNAQENASVWKTESGNFNGSRLASDLTAGVVLGTVGGVVSANVIKKNQIKKGYEVLHCAIGGQTVADWGDTFNAGFRR